MKTSKYIIIALLLLLGTVANAQLSNLKTENIKIYGNCGMCEKTIEKAGNVKNEAMVDWDKKTKMASVQYDSTKTSQSEILKRIALAGYDSDKFYAPMDTYATLPGCCQYERAKKELSNSGSDANENHGQMVMKNTEREGTTEKNPLQENPMKEVFSSYFDLKDALVATDHKKASMDSKSLVKVMSQIEMNKLPMDIHMVWMKVHKDILSETTIISNSSDIANQREHFILLSDKMYDLVKISKLEETVYYQFCPMANKGKGANWLSKENEVKNPYYGSMMLSCGKTVETIK
ncbi:Copper chaperone CopZ [Spirosomataceae bacterium TFI 002]|nr:Copper chaperone CopZ [Spirosomataceae bacterium TFI 002]